MKYLLHSLILKVQNELLALRFVFLAVLATQLVCVLNTSSVDDYGVLLAAEEVL